METREVALIFDEAVNDIYGSTNTRKRKEKLFSDITDFLKSNLNIIEEYEEVTDSTVVFITKNHEYFLSTIIGRTDGKEYITVHVNRDGYGLYQLMLESGMHIPTFVSVINKLLLDELLKVE